MDRDYWDRLNVVLVPVEIIWKTQRFIRSCEGCNPRYADGSFDVVLDRMTGNDPGTTDYLLEEPALCSRCRRDITEKTRIEWG